MVRKCVCWKTALALVFALALCGIAASSGDYGEYIDRIEATQDGGDGDCIFVMELLNSMKCLPDGSATVVLECSSRLSEVSVDAHAWYELESGRDGLIVLTTKEDKRNCDDTPVAAPIVRFKSSDVGCEGFDAKVYYYKGEPVNRRQPISIEQRQQLNTYELETGEVVRVWKLVADLDFHSFQVNKLTADISLRANPLLPSVSARIEETEMVAEWGYISGDLFIEVALDVPISRRGRLVIYAECIDCENLTADLKYAFKRNLYTVADKSYQFALRFSEFESRFAHFQNGGAELVGLRACGWEALVINLPLVKNCDVKLEDKGKVYERDLSTGHFYYFPGNAGFCSEDLRVKMDCPLRINGRFDLYLGNAKFVVPNGWNAFEHTFEWNGSFCEAVRNPRTFMIEGEKRFLSIRYEALSKDERNLVEKRLPELKQQYTETLYVKDISENICRHLVGVIMRPVLGDDTVFSVNTNDKTNHPDIVGETTAPKRATPNESTAPNRATPNESTAPKGTTSSGEKTKMRSTRSNGVATVNGRLVGMHANTQLTAFLKTLTVATGAADKDKVVFKTIMVADELHQPFVVTSCLSTSDSKYVKSVSFGPENLEITQTFRNGTNIVQCYVFNSCTAWKAFFKDSKSQLVVYGASGTVPTTILWRFDRAVKLEDLLPEEKKQTVVSRAGWYGTAEQRLKYIAPSEVQEMGVIEEGTTVRCVSRMSSESEAHETSASLTYVYLQAPFEVEPTAFLVFSGDWSGLGSGNVIVSFLAITIAVMSFRAH